MGTITEQDEGNGVTLVTETPRRDAAQPLELESPLSPVALAARLVDLQGEVRDLKARLLGDEEAEQRYAENRRTYVTPNIPKPDPGLLVMLQRHLTDQDDSFASAIKLLVTRVEKLEQLRAFFEPMLRDKTPPLDGALIVDRRQLDDALSRLAGAVREEMAEAVHFATTLERVFRDSYGAVNVITVDQRMNPHDKKLDRLGRLGWIAGELLGAWATAKLYARERRRPSRLQLAKDAIRTIVTGKESDQP